MYLAITKGIVLAAIVLFLYGGFLSNPYIFDDLRIFNKVISADNVMPEYHFAWLQGRSLPYASFYWTKLIAGERIEYFKIGNVVIHVLTAIVMYLAIRLLLQISTKETYKKTTLSLIAWVSATIFAVHPVATYAVGYLAQRTILMATLFSLVTVVLYIRASMTSSIVLLWMAVPAYYLAVYSKEHAIMLPFCLIALTVLLYKDWFHQFRREATFYGALTCVAFSVWYSRQNLVGSIYEPNGLGYLYRDEPAAQWAYLRSVFSQGTLYFKYAFLWIFPNPSWMSIDMREKFASGLLSFQALGAAGYLACGYVGIKLLLKRGLAGLFGFAILFPWIMFIAEFSTVRIQEIFVLYRSYLWSFGWILLFAILLLKLSANKIILIGVVAISILITFSFERLQTMAHPLLLWDDAAKLLEHNDQTLGVERIYYNRGVERYRLGQFEEAKSDFEKTIALYPANIEARANLAVILFKTNQWQRAVEQFNMVEKYGNMHNAYMNPKLVLGRAISYEKLGNIELAQIDYRRSCELASLGCENVEKRKPLTTSKIIGGFKRELQSNSKKE